MIAVVDYEAGNLTSVAAAVRKLGHECLITSEPAAVHDAERVVFPGVGAAGSAMRNLSKLALADCIREYVAGGRPFLGICVGFQLLFERSEEDDTDCLGILPGRVVRFPPSLRGPDGRPLKVPQIGWNRAEFHGSHPVWHGVAAGSEFYFVHSYFPVPRAEDICATTAYGIEFASGVCRGNVAAFQFHPEKSGRPGLKLLDNFCRWDPSA